MKRLVILILLSMLSLLFAFADTTENIGLSSILFQGTDKGFQWEKQATRGELRTVFFRYNEFIDEKYSYKYNLIQADFDKKISQIPVPKDYSLELDNLNKDIEVLSNRLKETRDSVARILKRERLEYDNSKIDEKVVQEWESPIYASATILNAEDHNKNILEAGYRFRWLDPDYIATGTPLIQLENGELFMGVKGEVRWGN